MECEQLVLKEDVIEPIGASEDACPTFIIPKKDGTVPWCMGLGFLRTESDVEATSVSIAKNTRCVASATHLQILHEIDILLCC